MLKMGEFTVFLAGFDKMLMHSPNWHTLHSIQVGQGFQFLNYVIKIGTIIHSTSLKTDLIHWTLLDGIATIRSIHLES